jgi:glucuronate isomerase
MAEAKEAYRREYLQRLREQYGDDDAAIALHMGVHIKYARRLLRRFGVV